MSFFIDQNTGTPKAGRIVSAIFIGVALISLILGSFTAVGAGQRGVITRLGAVQDRVLDEGFHFKRPFVDKVHKMDVSVQKAERDADSASKDLQTITTTVAVNYHLNPSTVNTVYQEFRRNYQANIIEPSIQEAVKASTAKFTAEELITKRPEVRDQMVAIFKERVEPYGFIVDGMSIVNFSFSSAFDEAIEAKVTAEQNALAAENKLKQVEFESQQRITQAKGEAEAIRIQAEAITSQGGQSYVQLQWIERWNGTLPTTMLGDDTSMLLTP